MKEGELIFEIENYEKGFKAIYRDHDYAFSNGFDLWKWIGSIVMQKVIFQKGKLSITWEDRR